MINTYPISSRQPHPSLRTMPRILTLLLFFFLSLAITGEAWAVPGHCNDNSVCDTTDPNACDNPARGFCLAGAPLPSNVCFGTIQGNNVSPAMGIQAAPAPGTGLISTIAQNIQGILGVVAGGMFMGIVGDPTFQAAIQAAVTLYIAIYGLLFMLGLTQTSLYDFVVRMVKIAVIVTLFQPNSWQFFSDNVIQFFNGGTDELINVVTAIAVGGVPANGPPFSVMDDAITKAVSAQMVVTTMATFASGPNGIVIGLLLVAALGSFLKSILNALWVYVMSLVLKALLFGLAPIFLCCLLFTRTRHLFDGWLNQIINASLQPLLLFTFFAFFAALINASLDNILSVPVCWTEKAQSFSGTPFSQHFWRFAVLSNGQWAPFTGQWNFTGAQMPQGQNSPAFPIDVMAVLVFMMLAELAGRFNGIVIEIAKDLAGAATNLSGMGGSITEAFSGVKKAVGSGNPGMNLGFGGHGGGGKV